MFKFFLFLKNYIKIYLNSPLPLQDISKAIILKLQQLLLQQVEWPQISTS